MHGVAFSFGLSSMLVDLLRCRPFKKAFYPEMDGYCFNMNAFYLYNSSMMLATDIVLYAMPMVFTRNLMLRKAQKVGLNCLFALGGLWVLPYLSVPARADEEAVFLRPVLHASGLFIWLP